MLKCCGFTIWSLSIYKKVEFYQVDVVVHIEISYEAGAVLIEGVPVSPNSWHHSLPPHIISHGAQNRLDPLTKKDAET